VSTMNFPTEFSQDREPVLESKFKRIRYELVPFPVYSSLFSSSDARYFPNVSLDLMVAEIAPSEGRRCLF